MRKYILPPVKNIFFPLLLVNNIIIKACLLYNEILQKTIKFILHDTYPCPLNTYHLSFLLTENYIVINFINLLVVVLFNEKQG